MEGLPRGQAGEGGSGDIQAVARVAQILELFGPQTPELTAAEIGERADLNRTTAYRYCTSMVAAGILDRGLDQGGFILGGSMLRLAIVALGRRRVMDLAPPHLANLSTRTHNTAVMSLWGSTGPVVSRVEEDAGQTVFVTVRVGTQLPLNASQTLLFLALHPDQLAMGRLIANLPQHRRAEVEEELERIRQEKHHVTLSPQGMVAIAAPVFDEYGICATVAVIGTSQTMSSDTDSVELQLVKETAAALSKEMGGAI